MSFHGGFIGVVLAVIFYCRFEGIPLLPASDLIAVCTPPGFFWEGWLILQMRSCGAVLLKCRGELFSLERGAGMLKCEWLVRSSSFTIV